jgi:outer membrane protein assembly factor BamB
MLRRRMRCALALPISFSCLVLLVLLVAGANHPPSSSYAFNSADSKSSSKSPTLTLDSPEAQFYGIFGNAVAASGHLVVVGAPGENVSGHGSAGRAYVFDATNGELITTLTSPNPYTSGEFGRAVAIDGDLVVVGAPTEDYIGHAYVFNATTGELIASFTSPNPVIYGYFGASVAIRGHVVVVGAYGEDFFSGHVYEFDATSGALLAQIAGPAFEAGGSFGWSVAIGSPVGVSGSTGAGGATILVGAPYQTVNGKVEAGYAYTYLAKTGRLFSTYSSPHSRTYGAFGYSVAFDSTTAVIAAGGIGGEDRVYVFNASSSNLVSEITNPKDHGFGWSVDISGGTVIVGAPFEEVKGQILAGRTYTYNATNGEEIQELAAPQPQQSGLFGVAVAVSGRTLVVGADGMNATGIEASGQVFVY